MSEHFPALLIVIPLMMAPVCVILRHALYAWFAALIANAVVVVMSICVLGQLLDGNVIHYALGGWAAPTGIEYYIDTVNGTLLFIVALVSLLALLFSLPTVRNEISQERHYLFYAGWLLCLTGLLGILITGDAFNVFVFLEISSLSMYMLIAMGRERKNALMAAFRYLIMGSVGASFILIGIGFLYAATGTLNMMDLAERIPEVSESRTVFVAFSFITLGLLIKSAVFPVYAWLPNGYQYAPSAVTVFLAGTATKVSLYVLLRFFYHIFGYDYSFGEMLLNYVMLPLSVAGFFIMSIVAIFQKDIRRMLAYSSVAQIGYIVTAVSMSTQEGAAAGMIHIINHAFVKAALFMAAFCLIYRIGSAQISGFRGAFRSMPWTCSAFVIAGLGLIGVPLTPGFVSKWHLISAAVANDWWIIVVLMLMSSLMAIVYIGRVIEAFYFKASDDEGGLTVKEAPLLMLIPLWCLIGICLYLGINGSVIVDLANTAAAQLFGGMQ